MGKKIIILHNKVLTDNPDELDVISQRDLVKKACENLDYEVVCLTVGNDLINDLEKVKDEKADMVFNLVEATWGKGELIYFAPAILNSYKIPYTGVPLDALFITTNKVLAKKLMRYNDLPTADFFSINELDKLNPDKTYIAKPIWEEASVGISSDYIFKLSEKNKVEKIKQLSSSHYFVEEFIDGREFNVSILADKTEAEVLPPAEMIFSGYFDDKPKIVGYKAKWDESSEEYKQTNRSFGTLENNQTLKDKLTEICKKSWKVFNLRGYVRIDFRVDKNDNIYILEINGNPCIAPDSGFVAAIENAGYNVDVMIQRIIADLN
ncbi:MAG: ATP-grasp domain-containing protein [Saprospiraceae bacterium]|nr:ATP-grasp domain-containing protein [Saprospiraceae bacterium]